MIPARAATPPRHRQQRPLTEPTTNPTILRLSLPKNQVAEKGEALRMARAQHGAQLLPPDPSKLDKPPFDGADAVPEPGAPNNKDAVTEDNTDEGVYDGKKKELDVCETEKTEDCDPKKPSAVTRADQVSLVADTASTSTISSPSAHSTSSYDVLKESKNKPNQPTDIQEIRNANIKEPSNPKEDTTNWPFPLKNVDYFHGYMPIGIVRRQLVEQGQFVSYITNVNKQECTVVSVLHDNLMWNYLVHMTKNGRYYVNDAYVALSVPSLVDVLKTTKTMLEPGGPVLEKPVPRPPWIWDSTKVNPGKVIGKGAFGEVYDGTFGDSKCAIKVMATPGATDGSSTLGTVPSTPDGNNNKKKKSKTEKGKEKKVDPAIGDKMMFINEAVFLATLEHKSVIAMFGLACLENPIMIVMELATGSSLLKFMRKSKVPIKQKRIFVLQILSGMAYLEKNLLIHRDLAARNVLLDDKMRCKISDFGISCYTDAPGKEVKGNKQLKLAIRWLSPEAIEQGIFSTKSDVWAFGVVAYEVFSDGAVPYNHVKTLREVKVGIVSGKVKLQPTPCMGQRDSEMMANCFIDDRSARPTFNDLKKRFKPKSWGSRVYEMKDALLKGSKPTTSLMEKPGNGQQRNVPAISQFFDSDRNRKNRKK
ncbi:unnamed protein product, partial [Mesorhabditis spiculigera]